jgi:hypothetical protein
MSDKYDLKTLGLNELAATTGTINTTDKIIVVDPTTFTPRLELISNLPA